MVTEYLYDRCRYLAGSLKPFIYLLPKSSTRIDYLIDNYKCEVRQIIYDGCIKIEGFKTTLNVTESVDNRLDFTTKVTLSMREKWDENWIALTNELKMMNCYVVVEDYNGTQYIQSPEFVSNFTYSYEFNSDNQGHNAQLTYDCDSNMPVIILDNNVEASVVYSDDCAYQDGGIKDFRMTPYQYVLIDNNNETGEFTTITCTGGETMHKIEFTPKTFKFRQQYDGRNYQETLTFKIPLSDYKYYFRYNLVEFKENRYAITFTTTQDNWIASGFEFGFQPTYTVETSETVDDINSIEITLNHVGQNSIFYSEEEPTIVESVTEKYVPVTNPIKDPVTGLELRYWHCRTKTEAIYTLIQMVTESGVPTDRYMCLDGYETYYENINIVETYQADDNFDFELTFPNSDCAITDNCKFTKMTKEIYSFRTVGDYYDVHIQNPCPWILTDIPSWINCDRLSGDGDIDYVVRFTSRETATRNRKVAYGILQSFDNVSRIQFILEEKADWMNPIEHNITAQNQAVYTYIDLDYDDYEICEVPEGITVEKMADTSAIRIYVPENRNELLSASYNIKVCNLTNGEETYIHIYQDHLYSRFVEDIGSYICDNQNSFQKMDKYIGYTPYNITIRTDITQKGNVLITHDEQCTFDDGSEMYRWNDNTGETICLNDNKYTREDYQVSYDDGQTWTNTGEYRAGTLVEASSPDCMEKQYKWEVDDTRWVCVGTTSYYYEVKYESTDGINWIKTEPEEIQPSQTIRLQEDSDCGWSETIFRWVDDGDNFICEDGGTPTPTPTTETRWIDMPTSEYVCDGYDKYSEEKEQVSTDGGLTWTDTGNTRVGDLIETYSTDCGFEDEEWREETDSYICMNGKKYQTQIRYYWTNNGWVTDGERRTGNIIENNSTDCVGVQSDTSGKMYLFSLCNLTPVCMNNILIHKATRKRNDDRQGLIWIDDSANCAIETRGVTPSSCGTNDYLTTEIMSNGTIGLTKVGNTGLTNIAYSKNNGTWTSLAYGEEINVSNGDTIRWKANGYVNNNVYSTGNFILANYNYDYSYFNGTSNFYVYGNPKSLLYSDNYNNMDETNITVCFAYLFYNSKVVSAENLIMPTNMAHSCCYGLFANCSSLTTAPELPATTLAEYCYYSMFYGCTSLTTTPELPATTLAEYCYGSMFQGCRNLTTAPELPATTLARGCYEFMFWDGTSLTTAPELPATTSAKYCYYYMFYGCTNLNYINCQLSSFLSNATTDWVRGVQTTSGTFIYNCSNTNWSRGNNGIPNNWTASCQ